jgi:hypothetical protein
MPQTPSEIFAALDLDQDGRVSCMTLMSDLLGRGVDTAQLVQLFAQLEANQSVNLEEFTQGFERYVEATGAPGEAGNRYSRRGATIALTEHRAMELEQLHTFFNEVQQILNKATILDSSPQSPTHLQPITPHAATMYHLCTHFIIPITEPFKCSFAEMVAQAPQPPTWFLSHAWAHPFARTLQMLDWHSQCRDLGMRARYWICTFAKCDRSALS